jgi:hypothetical protein
MPIKPRFRFLTPIALDWLRAIIAASATSWAGRVHLLGLGGLSAFSCRRDISSSANMISTSPGVGILPISASVGFLPSVTFKCSNLATRAISACVNSDVDSIDIDQPLDLVLLVNQARHVFDLLYSHDPPRYVVDRFADELQRLRRPEPHGDDIVLGVCRFVAHSEPVFHGGLDRVRYAWMKRHQMPHAPLMEEIHKLGAVGQQIIIRASRHSCLKIGIPASVRGGFNPKRTGLWGAVGLDDGFTAVR